MNVIDQFTGLFPLSKTLRFKLIPMGKTEEFILAKDYIKADEQRVRDYKAVKSYIDRYHRSYIDETLRSAELPVLRAGLPYYAELYFKHDRSEEEQRRKQEMETKFRIELSSAKGGVFELDKEGEKLIYGKELVSKTLPGFLENESEKETVQKFSSFFTYFYGFNDNRRNVYSGEEIATAIGFRCVNENLPRFLDNVKAYERLRKTLPQEKLDRLRGEIYDRIDASMEDLFLVEHFPYVLTQKGIDVYNAAVGGFTAPDGNGKKIQGLNELVNEYNQIRERDARLPRLKPLYKQILSDRVSISFIPESFENDSEVMRSIRSFFTGEGLESGFFGLMDRLAAQFSDLTQYDLEAVFLNKPGLSAYSAAACGGWNAIKDVWVSEYDAAHPGKQTLAYEERREAAWKAFSCISLEQLRTLADKIELDARRVAGPAEYFSTSVCDALDQIHANYGEAETLLQGMVPGSLQSKDEAIIAPIKSLLDSVKALESLLRPFTGTDKEGQGDARFYGDLLPSWDALRSFDRLYDRVRNYVTQKPYSREKFKLNFNCSSFLSGWSQDWATHDSFLIEKDDRYYLAVLERGLSEAERTRLLSPGDTESSYLEYRLQKVDFKNFPRLFIRSKADRYAPAVRQYNLPVESILDIYDSRLFTARYRTSAPEVYQNAVHKMIDYYKLGLSQHESYRHFNLRWKDTASYASMDEFYSDVQSCCYQISKVPLDWAYLEQLTASGDLLLFQIYNKDFSPHSKGKPNLHTLYFRMLFDQRNLEDPVFKLSGGAEMFYRKASLPEKVTHPANTPIANKNPARAKQKPESVFAYDLIKDKRYTRPQFSLHIPIEINTNATGAVDMNDLTRKVLRNAEETYVIGIDRGERNLLYICVVDGKGRVVEQRSLNEIVGGYGGVPCSTDYQALLVQREADNYISRQTWSNIQGIRELKEGYLSQVVHELCRLVKKYNAVIALEDLNSGFKNSRRKVERQVYQKFENALIDKLSFMADKSIDAAQPGGLLHAYQLARRPKNARAAMRQNGFLVYVPAWLTSKIDPVTGFVDLLHPHYTSIPAALDFIGKLEEIRYEPENDLFVFEVDYEKFPGTAASARKKWTLCSNGERIRSYRDRTSGKWATEAVTLSREFMALFTRAGINVRGDIRAQLLKINEKTVLESFIRLFALMLQMRNSIPNTQTDYLVSPARDTNGSFFRSDALPADASLPENADANGAYNIARKALWMIDAYKSDPEATSLPTITNAQWLEYTQRHE